MELTFYNRVWESLYYVLVIVSWKFRLLWEYLENNSSPEGSCLTQKTPPNQKTFTPVMRSKRLSSSRRSIHGSYRKMTPMSRQLNRNLFGETNDLTTPRPNKTLFLDPPNNDLPEEELFFQPIRYSHELCREL